MSKEPIEYLKHILDECSYVISVSGSDQIPFVAPFERLNELRNLCQNLRHESADDRPS